MVKTNAMRLLEAASIPYETREYPVDEEVDLKKAAKAAGEKKVELIPVKQLQRVTGYIRGGCSPIGMKKRFPTFIEETAAFYEKISISGGNRGVQIVIDPQKLIVYLEGKFAVLTQK